MWLALAKRRRQKWQNASSKPRPQYALHVSACSCVLLPQPWKGFSLQPLPLQPRDRPRAKPLSQAWPRIVGENTCQDSSSKGLIWHSQCVLVRKAAPYYLCCDLYRVHQLESTLPFLSQQIGPDILVYAKSRHGKLNIRNC